MSRELRREEYTVGWVCALPVELAAVQEMLDEEHRELQPDDNDENLYSLGSIAGHNVVIVCLPAGRIGNNPAAAVAAQMRATFKGIRFGLMVGIGGGVPSAEADIRLGDVVVSQPHQTFGGVIQYDLGKATPSGFERTGLLNPPPQILLAAVARMRANELRGRSKLSEHVSKLERIPKFRRDKTGQDVLFKAAYQHKGGRTCDLCDTNKQEARQPRESDEVLVHYGTIASGNQVIRDGRTRDKLSSELGGILCFEMEAAGLMNSFPCLVIRGICDYSDSHKNKTWQPYAAATAAACAKEILSFIPTAEITKKHAREATEECRMVLLHQEADPFNDKRRLLQPDLPPQIWWQKLVVLNDARGRSFPFFLELIDSAELFVEVLKYKFKDLGLGKVMRREWFLQDHHSGRILDLTKPWGALVRPGQTLDMTMKFRKQSVSYTHCPNCHSENNGPPETRTRCSTCGLVYQRIEEIQDIGVQRDDFQPQAGSDVYETPEARQNLPEPSPRPRLPKPRNDEDDISHYARVQLVNTRFRVQKAEQSSMVAVLATLRPQDLENVERLSAYLSTVCGLSEEECLAALKACDSQLLAIRAVFESTATVAGPDGVMKTNSKKRGRIHDACVYCRRSHMTCDLERPCNRCIKRNIAHLCHDEPSSPVDSNFRDMHRFDYSNTPSASEFTNEYNLLNDFLDAELSRSQVSQNILPPPSFIETYDPAFFDPSDPALFNFDISGHYFGNHYGALELGMLDHMTAGMSSTSPDNDNNNKLNSLDVLEQLGSKSPQITED